MEDTTEAIFWMFLQGPLPETRLAHPMKGEEEQPPEIGEDYLLTTSPGTDQGPRPAAVRTRERERKVTFILSLSSTPS
ncbi:hypothetical protein NHX12_021527 [Muraenolepis orangiensis]|uniref:Uncharacterized protein n=1 Tax=Muraenolepis orangiensis TaxID=630683 RepID=A0A9Q0EQ69_9TELE|nr:hypothetical protein NHX12_021527 [Muraenolepis orangiensis]